MIDSAEMIKTLAENGGVIQICLLDDYIKDPDTTTVYYQKRKELNRVFDTKYDLPMDFYIKLGFTLNYDNQPVEGAPEADYVFSTGFGWSW